MSQIYFGARENSSKIEQMMRHSAEISRLMDTTLRLFGSINILLVEWKPLLIALCDWDMAFVA
jgi:hypothetical protein